MSQVRVNQVVNATNDGPPRFPFGAIGIGTTTTRAEYADVAGIATDAQGLTGSPDISVSQLSVSGVSTFNDDVTVDGLLETPQTGTVRSGRFLQVGKVVANTNSFGPPVGAYLGPTVGVTIDQLVSENDTGDDRFVTATFGFGGSVDGLPNGGDAAGIATVLRFRSDNGRDVLSLTHDSVGFGTDVEIAGIVNPSRLSVSQGSRLEGYKFEDGSIDTSTSLTGTFDYNISNGHIQTWTSATSGNYGPNFIINGSTIDAFTDVGDVMTATVMVASSSHYLAGANIQIDGSSANLDINYVGGSAPSAANGSGYDIYSFTIQKSAATPAYIVTVNALGAN